MGKPTPTRSSSMPMSPRGSAPVTLPRSFLTAVQPRHRRTEHGRGGGGHGHHWRIPFVSTLWVLRAARPRPDSQQHLLPASQRQDRGQPQWHHGGARRVTHQGQRPAIMRALPHMTVNRRRRPHNHPHGHPCRGALRGRSISVSADPVPVPSIATTILRDRPRGHRARGCRRSPHREPRYERQAPSPPKPWPLMESTHASSIATPQATGCRGHPAAANETGAIVTAEEQHLLRRAGERRCRAAGRACPGAHAAWHRRHLAERVPI